jgi:uridylate kinase
MKNFILKISRAVAELRVSSDRFFVSLVCSGGATKRVKRDIEKAFAMGIQRAPANYVGIANRAQLESLLKPE